MKREIIILIFEILSCSFSRDDEEREGDDIFLEIWNYINFRRFRTNN